ncbi:MAG: ATP-binding protein [candidate division Zixibacteria bacterium]
MILRGKNIKDFELSDFQELVTDKTEESITLEFKQEMYKKNDKGKKELLKDISAMANAYGGIIIIGISDEDHRAKELIGVENAKDFESDINKCAKDSIKHPINHLETFITPFDDNKSFITIIVPNSSNKPFMVQHGNHWRFWKRVGTDNLPMSVQEIKDMVLFEEYKVDKVTRFWEKRKAELIEHNTPRPHLVLSMIPNRFARPELEFTRDFMNSISNSSVFAEISLYPEIGLFEHFLNGIRAYSSIGKSQQSARVTYSIFENGYIELFGSCTGNPDGICWDIKGNNYVYRPEVLAKLLVLGGCLLKTIINKFYDQLGTEYEIVLWTTSTRNLAFYETFLNRQIDKIFKETEFSISHTVKDTNLKSTQIIYPIFRKFINYLGTGRIIFGKEGLFESGGQDLLRNISL